MEQENFSDKNFETSEVDNLKTILDGSLPTDRMSRYCIINETWAESSCFGSVSADEVLEQMMVNDGQVHRGFRKNIFNPVLTVIGIATGHHASGGTIAQFDYAKGILKEG